MNRMDSLLHTIVEYKPCWRKCIKRIVKNIVIGITII